MALMLGVTGVVCPTCSRWCDDSARQSPFEDPHLPQSRRLEGRHIVQRGLHVPYRVRNELSMLRFATPQQGNTSMAPYLHYMV